MMWGRPQPETVRDYRIEGEVQGRWVCLESITGNHQRRRVHPLAPGHAVAAVRIVVTATHGLDHARICELRCYGPQAAG
jgi:hypothetical protein